MPQDGLRSAVYRSFVTCDDPKGVVDCGMIRKSKSGSQKMEQKTENHRRKSKNSSTSLDCKAEKDEKISEGFTGNFHSPSSFQLREVSRGAQKLNHMIDSWSNGMRFDGQHKDIAKDLLKGALDLQESLVMLGKFQEASQYMSHLNKRHIGKSERRRNDGVQAERAYSNHYGDHQNSVTEFQKPRLSADGSSRSSTEELKKVIRDSLVRQKLFENTTTAEKGFTFFPHRCMDSCSDSPSTSSSQSSLFHTASETTIASAAPQRAKGPNLIAKLMGIEEYPYKPLQASLKKQIEEGEKISNQQRPMFDIDMPKVRKPQTVVQKVDSERRTLREVLETMQFKGLLKRNSVKEHKPDFHHCSDSNSKERFIRERPPIVLIKPLPDPSLELEEPQHAPLVQGEEAFYTKKMLKKLRTEEELCSKTINCKEEALKSDKMHQKMEAEETPIKKLNEEGAKNHKVAVGKPEEKEAKSTKEKASRKLKASHPVDHKPQKKEAIDKKVDKIQKVTSVSRKSPEKDIVKAKNVSKSQDQDKVTSPKARKPEPGSNIVKNQISRQPGTLTNIISKRSTSTQTVVGNSTERKRNHLKKERPVKEPTGAKSVTKNVVSEGNDKRIESIDIDHTSDSTPIRPDNALADQRPKEEETDIYGSQSGGHCSNCQTSLCDATPLNPKQETEVKTAEEASEHISQSGRDGKISESQNLGDFLFSNPSFLSLAEEFFDLNVKSFTILQTSSLYNFGVSSRRLYLDCANELIECKSFQDSQAVNPLLLTCQGKPRTCISLHKLVDEVCNGIENLQKHSKLAGESFLADSIYEMLQRDIMCKEVVNGTWDLGWRNGFSRDEAEQVVNDIEKMVLNELIEEVFA